MAEAEKPDQKAEQPKPPKFTEADFKQYKELLRTINEEHENLKVSYEDFMKVFSDSQALSMLKAVNKEAEALEDNIDTVGSRWKDSIVTIQRVNVELGLAAKLMGKSKEAAKNVNIEEAERKVGLKEINRATESITSSMRSMYEDAIGIDEMDESQLQKLIEKTQKDRERLTQANELAKLSGADLDNYNAIQKSADELITSAKERLKQEEAITKKMGLTGVALKGVKNIMEKLGMGDYFKLDDTLKKMRKAKTMTEAMEIGFEAVGSAVKKALTDPVFLLTAALAVMTKLVTAALHFQNHVFEMAKSMGVSVGRAKELEHTFMHIATSNSKLALTMEDVQKTYQELSDNLGVSVTMNEEFLQDSTAISRNLGLSAAQMEAIQVSSQKNGKSVKETYANVIGTAKVAAVQKGIHMSEKQILDGISKVSATVYNNFKGNAAELAKAVVTATKFGTTLNDINSAGSQMLNFQDSIGKEFEAQLLTGRQIDLSMARQYALTGQTDKLMGEITRNIGSQAQWSKMNVMQQESLAEAMGMNKTQVDEMFKKQEMIRLLGKDADKSSAEQYEALTKKKMTHAQIVKIMGEEAANQAMQASAQQQMKASMDNLSKAAGAIAYAFMPVIKIVELIAASINGISSAMGWINKNAGWLVTTMQVLLGIYASLKVYSAFIAFKQKEGWLWSLKENAQKAISWTWDKLKITNLKGTWLWKVKENIQNSISNMWDRMKLANMTSIKAGLQSMFGISAKNAVVSAGDAGAKAAAASAGPTLGFGALAVGLATTAGLLAMLAGLGAMGGGGASVPTASSLPAQQKSMKPLNTAAANAGTMKNFSETKGATEIKLYQTNEVHPVTGKVITKVKSETVDADGQTGSNAQVKIGDSFAAKKA